MRCRVTISDRARSDLRRAFSWMEERAPLAAAAWFDRIDAAILGLAAHPLRCPRAREASSLGVDVRQLLVGRYRVIFSVVKQRVHVHHVRHAARRSFGEPREEE